MTASPQLIYAIVNLDTYSVIDLKPYTSIASVPASNSAVFYLAEGRDFDSAVTIPHLGDEWNGAIGAANCRFNPPAPPANVPTDAPSGIANLRQTLTSALARLDELDALITGGS